MYKGFKIVSQYGRHFVYDGSRFIESRDTLQGAHKLIDLMVGSNAQRAAEFVRLRYRTVVAAR